MGIIDSYLIYRFIRGLTIPFDETAAFKKGIIDAKGDRIKDKLTDDDSASYTLFDRLIFNIKKLIEKLPGGKTRLGTYAAALFLIREELGDDEGVLVFERSVMKYLKEKNAMDPNYLTEQYLSEETLSQGNYKTTNSMLDVQGNSIPKGTTVVANHDLQPLSRVLGVNVFQLQVAHTGRNVVVSREDVAEL